MALTQEQLKGLNAASARIASGAANDVDIKNVDYAKKNFGYTYQAPVSGTQGVQQVQQNQAQQIQPAALTPTQYNQIRAQNNVSSQNFDQYFERRGTDIYAKNQAQAQQTSIQEPVPNVNIPDVIPQQDFERFNNANDLGELKNQVTNAVNNYQNQLVQAQQIALPNVNLRQQLSEDTGLIQKQQQLTQLNDALRNLEDDLTARFQGRDISSSEFQAELSRRGEPLSRKQQMLYEQVTNIQQQINQQVSDQWQQYQAQWQQAQGNAQLANQYLQTVQGQLEFLLDQQRQGMADELQLLDVALKLPEGEIFTLSDGTQITGMGGNGNLHFIQEVDDFGNLTIIGIDNQGNVQFDKTYEGISTSSNSKQNFDLREVTVNGEPSFAVFNKNTGQIDVVGSSEIRTEEGARTDRHYNPLAISTANPEWLQQLNQSGINYSIGDKFPNDPGLSTIQFNSAEEGIQAMRVLLSNETPQGKSAFWWYRKRDGVIFEKYGVNTPAQFGALPEAIQDSIINQIYKEKEGGDYDSIYDIKPKSADKKLSATQQKTVEAIQIGAKLVDQAEQIYWRDIWGYDQIPQKQFSPDVSEKGKSIIKGVVSLSQLNEKFNNYQNFLDSNRAPIAKGIKGESGNLAEQEQKNALKSFPTRFSSPYEAQQAFINIRKQMNDQISSINIGIEDVQIDDSVINSVYNDLGI